jgi:uncharacterized membrane protein
MLMKSRKILSFNKKVTVATFFGLGFWIAGIIITPVLANQEEIFFQKIAAFIYFFYQPVCHQIGDRSFLIDGFTMTVCVRCFSFYLGGFFITSFYLFKDKIQMWRISTYILLALPAFLDFSIEKLSFYSNIAEIRFLTGLLFGVVLFHLLLLSLSTKKAKPLLQHSNTPTTQ